MTTPFSLTNMLLLPRGAPGVGALKRALTIRSRFDPEVELALYRESAGALAVPRYAPGVPGISTFKGIDLRVEGAPMKFIVRTKPREGQAAAISAFRTEVAQGVTGFLLDAPTASGKTFLALSMLSFLGKTALVLVPKSDLVDQWLEEIHAHTNLPPAMIGRGISGDIDRRGKALVVSVTDTALKHLSDGAFRDSWGVVVYDEVDYRTPATMLHRLLGAFPAKYRIAMSATLRRRDGLDRVYAYHVGECVLSTESAVKQTARVVRVHYSAVWGSVPQQLPVKTRRSILLGLLEKDSTRTAILCRIVMRLYKDSHRVLVISDRTAQLAALRKMLIKTGLKVDLIGFYTDSVRMGSGTRSVPKWERDRAAKTCATLLATYGMCGAGTNLPTVSALVLATPRASAVQARGRVERYVSGKQDPVVVDLIDDRFPDAVNWGYARLKEYRKAGLSVSERWVKNDGAGSTGNH